MPGPPLPELRVNEIGEFIRHQSCQRRFKLEIEGRKEARRLPFHDRLFGSLDPVLQEEGRKREDQWATMLRDAGYTQISPEDQQATELPWEELAGRLAESHPGDLLFATEVRVRGTIGAFPISGRIDFVILQWSGDRPTLRIVEGKASRRDRTYHRVQVAAYLCLLCQTLEGSSNTVAGVQLGPDDIEAVVARVDEATNTPQAILAIEPLSLEMEQADLQRLTAEGGIFARIASTALDDLPYQLDQKCDGCVFSTDCFPESGLHRRIQLLGAAPATVRTLRRVGVTTIDALADLDPESPTARDAQADPSFSESVRALITRARARRRGLPGAGEGFEVESLDNRGYPALPEHEISGTRLIRVYLCVDYDYAENRVGALSAHVTTSAGLLHTPFVRDDDNRWRPHPEALEVIEAADIPDDPCDMNPVHGEDIVRFKGSEWSGNAGVDAGAERELIEGFLLELVAAMDRVAPGDEAPVHFYVWSPGEMAQLIEGCTRAGSRLLAHLRHLMGCRESLEQLIYSSVGREIDRHFGLKWTGRGLAVVASLRWFGRLYHWSRQVGREVLQLDHELTQDIFDFKTTLRVSSDGTWANPDDETSPQHLFEIRSRFFDSLSAPYWRAVWGTLPDPDEVQERDPRLARMIGRYYRARRPEVIKQYLRARTHALRWLEERVRFKNHQIVKPPVRVPELRDFDLGRDTVSDAAVDFLRLDHHVKATEWMSCLLQSPRERVASFAALPLRNVRAPANNVLEGDLDLEAYGLSREEAESNSALGEGTWTRFSPRPDGIDDPQSLGLIQRLSHTCFVRELDWESGTVRLEVIPFPQADRYRLQSNPVNAGEVNHTDGLLEESLSDFVAPKVDDRLTSGLGAHATRWLDPRQPAIPDLQPLSQERLEQIRVLLNALRLSTDGSPLSADQQRAVIGGASARISLLQGPPGTGKTHTSAIAVLLRVLLRCGQGDLVLIGGPTHRAVDTLLTRIAELRGPFEAEADSRGLDLPQVALIKVTSTAEAAPLDAGIATVRADLVRPITRALGRGAVIAGGTVSSLLKAAGKWASSSSFGAYLGADGTIARALFVDEASMMVFPHFLALATLVHPDGEVIVAGDHRQLAPIMAHDWEREDRPPTVIYQPFVSAYEAVRNIHDSLAENQRPGRIVRTALEHSFRLPPEIRELIARVYVRDEIELRGRETNGRNAPHGESAEGLHHVWCQPSGLYLVLHDERESRRYNETEAAIIREMLGVGAEIQEGSVAIITPHRAQRSLISRQLGGHPAVSIIDTVERLQGGQSSTVIVSATASDPAAISANVEFLLNLNRSNVAFSRAQDRLIVVCSEALLEHVPPEVDQYQSAELWKALPHLCTVPLATGEINGHRITLRMCPAATARALHGPGGG